MWLPRIGGSYFEFFQPVFNIADAAITIGILLFVIAHRRMKHAQAEAPIAAPLANAATSDAQPPPTTVNS